MATRVHSLEVYEELAAWYDRQGQAKLRDWFLILAADIALSLGQQDDAERLRLRLLHLNPHHLLRPFSSFADALQAPDVRSYVVDLRRRYPLETAEQLWASTRGKRAPAAATPEPPDTPPLPRQEDRELKVYRIKEPFREAAPPPVRQEQKPATSHPTMPRMRPLRSAAPPQTEPPADAPEPSEEVDDGTGLAWWVSTILFVVTLLVAGGLAAYVLVVPFLSM